MFSEPSRAIVEQVFELSIILVLVLVNGLFAGAEIAVVTSRRSAILEQAERGSASAKALVRLMDSPERFLATVQVGIPSWAPVPQRSVAPL